MSLFVQPKNIIPKVFLYCMALQPVIALLWQEKILFFKLNWLLFPVILLAISVSLLMRKKAPSVFYYFILVFILFSISLLGRPTDWEGVFRIFITLLPLTFLQVQEYNSDAPYRTFWSIYFLCILIPLFISYLQYSGRFPYYEFDAIDDERTGRISGGYNKPNNFVAFLFPLYLFGFYRWKIQRKPVQGLLIIFFVMGIVYYTGLRTAVAIFFLIFICAFFHATTIRLIHGYYKYYLNFMLGTVSFVTLFIAFQKTGLIDGLRGRIPMWLAHADDFFRSSWLEILTGRGQVLLDPKYKQFRIVGSLEEVHNNTFRTIVVFGLIGYFLYCTFVRWIALSVYEWHEDSRLKFIRLSCFLFLILYSITNEPAYYSSILWSVLLGIFPVWKRDSFRRLA